MFSRPDPAANLGAYLYCGVTTVVDLGDLGSWSLARRDTVAKGDLFGPTLYAAGPVVTARGDPSFGVVAVGKHADLLLVDGDPREDLNHLARIRAVIVRGVTFCEVRCATCSSGRSAQRSLRCARWGSRTR